MNRFLAFFVVIFLASAQSGHSSETVQEKTPQENRQKPGFASLYLQSHFAQLQSDWNSASHYLDKLIGHETENFDLLRRAMILAVGAGDFDTAAKHANVIYGLNKSDSLVYMILSLEAARSNKNEQALEFLKSMPDSDTTDFVRPLLKAWALAEQGRIDDSLFNQTSLYNYHKALIQIYLGNEKAAIKIAEAMFADAAGNQSDMHRAADILVVAGNTGKALQIYEDIIQKTDGDNKVLNNKVEALRHNEAKDSHLFDKVRINSLQEGIAQALYDMAFILYREKSTSSTRLFSNLTLALDPTRNDARLLLADSLVQAGRYQEAIDHLSNLTKDHPSYLETQRYIADLIAQTGDKDQAREKLNNLFIKYNDIDALIQVGDLYRQEENYKNALKVYNQAADQIGTTIPEDYWYLLYVRGMANEREGDWHKAEQDLKAALVYRPDHPYLLNYLGYGWAEQGLELEKSLDLIKRAVALRPNDGYITDSLGWVYYKKGRYEEAVPVLEKAVSLLPYDPTINDHLGDAYWKVGRVNEAKFQWRRALNYTEDQSVIGSIQHKIQYGLPADKGYASASEAAE